MKLDITITVDYGSRTVLKFDGDPATLMKTVKCLPTIADLVGELASPEGKEE